MYILLVCLFVCVLFLPINVKTAEPIRQQFCVGPHIPEKVYGKSKLEIKFLENSWNCFLNASI